MNKIDNGLFINAPHQTFERMATVAESRGDDYRAAKYLELATLVDRAEWAEWRHGIASPLADDPADVWEPTARLSRVRDYCRRCGIDYSST
jgi:hypothetical protein